MPNDIVTIFSDIDLIALIINVMSAISYSSFQRDFRFQQNLGKGNYSTVNQVLHNVDSRTYAHKITELSSIDDFVHCFNEIETLKTIDDDHLAKLYYYYGRENKQTGRLQIGLIMELCGASLSQVISQRRRRGDYFSLSEVREFVCSMVCFFAKMQRKGYMHRDIKPDNILLSRCKQKYKIVDFGFAIKLNHYSTQNVAGTMEYVSPKLRVKFKDNSIMVEGHTFKDDVYSFGKTLLELMLLQTNAKMPVNRISECNARYGLEFSALVRLMTEGEEIRRPDFVQLQKEMMRLGIIEVAGVNDSKETTISRSTVKDPLPKRQETDPSKFTNDRSKSSVGNRRERGDTKTKRKDMLQDTRSEADYSKQSSPTNKKKVVIKKQQRQCKVSVVKFSESVCSMASFENIFFLGLQGKLGVMVGGGERVVKLVIEKFSREITVIDVSVGRKMLFFASLDCVFYMVAISEIKRLIADKSALLGKKREIEVPLSSVVFRVWNMPKPVSCVCDCSTDELGKEMVLILGHYTGEISVINENTGIKTTSLGNEPVTGIAYHAGYVYTSNTLGTFKRQSAISCGLAVKNQQIQKTKALLCEQPQYYRCNETIITFQIISDCKANQSIAKVENQYLALVPCCDGMLHIVSKSMRCEKMVRISQSQMLTAYFEPVPSLPLGVRMTFVNQEGVVLDQNGTVQQNSGAKKVNCMGGGERMLLLGSYEKTVTILPRRQAITIEEV